MNARKVIVWLVVALGVFYVIQAPERSGEFVESTGQTLGDLAASLAELVGSVV